jgi:hypothetical protein
MIIRGGAHREGASIYDEHASVNRKTKALAAYGARHYEAPKGLGENTLIAEVLAAYRKAAQASKLSLASHLTSTA